MNQPDRAQRNALVPFLDLFGRLDDAELGRLADVPSPVVAGLRTQVEAVQKAFAGREELLPKLRDSELARLLGADVRTIQFWRLTCLPPSEQQQPPARAGQSGTQMHTQQVVAAPSGPIFDRSGDLASGGEPPRRPEAPRVAPAPTAPAAKDDALEIDAVSLDDDDDDDLFANWSDL